MKRDELALQQKPPVKPSDEGDGATDEEHKIYAADLVAALGVTEEIAEEMIYIADLQQNQSITFTEFRQAVAGQSSASHDTISTSYFCIVAPSEVASMSCLPAYSCIAIAWAADSEAREGERATSGDDASDRMATRGTML
eukprot:4406525-Prymnesium_polylepis.1